jgi:hypothetical protein
MARQRINYAQAMEVCNPGTTVTVDQLDEAIRAIFENVYAGWSEEDLALIQEEARDFAEAVRRRLAIFLPTSVIIKRLLGTHK